MSFLKIYLTKNQRKLKNWIGYRKNSYRIIRKNKLNYKDIRIKVK